MSETNGDRPRLLLPRLAVTLADGRVISPVQILNVDLLRWDRTAAKHSWPHFESVPAWHSTFVAWSALRRTGAIPADMSWESFSDEHCEQVTAITADGTPADGADGLDAVDPTRPEAAPA